MWRRSLPAVGWCDTSLGICEWVSRIWSRTLGGFFVAKVWQPAAGGVISNYREMLLFGPENSRERIRVEGGKPPGMLYYKGKQRD
jgi:hypothetical protein